MKFTSHCLSLGLCVLFGLCLCAGCDSVKPVASGANSQPAADSPPDPPASVASEASLPNAALAESNGPPAEVQPQGNLAQQPVTPPNASSAILTSPPGISSPSLDNAGEAQVRDRTDLLNRPFATLRPLVSEVPGELLEHLRMIDAAMQDLRIAGTNNILEKDAFIEFGMRLGKMKLDAGQQLSNLAAASSEQRKAGVLASLIALSHMSGLGDVESAKKLEVLARGMADSADPELAHECRVVLLGFELQSLQNGLSDDTEALVRQVEGLFTRPEDRDSPEFMMVQQAIYVLNQMGFEQDAERIQEILVREYLDSEDAQLRTQAWSYLTRGSQALDNFNQASRAIASPNFNPEDLLSAARGLFDAFPRAQTLEQMAGSVANIEYAGFVSLSQQLSEWIQTEMAAFETTSSSLATARFLTEHQARLALIGKPLELDSLVDFQGKPINWDRYQGKVVLVDFWATWCVPCLREIPNIRKVYDQYSSQGFDVIGVNMDESLQAAENFISKQAYPWTNYHFQDASGFGSEFAMRNGLQMIPFVVLVNRSGDISQIHVRGENLEPAVRAALGLDTSLIPDEQDAP